MFILTALILTTVLSGCGSSNNNAVNNVSEVPTSAAGGSSNGPKETISINIGEDDYGARMTNYEAAFKALNEELAAQGKNVEVKANILPSVGDDELILQAKAGNNRDIFMNSSVDIGWELDAGLIQPMDWLKESEVFKDLPANLWDVMTYQGHIYGAIQDMDVGPMFVFKPALKQLGWTEDQIASLPELVKAGEFSLDDVLQLGAEAVKQKVTKYGLVCDGIDGCQQAINLVRHDGVSGYYDINTNKMIVDKAKIIDSFSFWSEGLKNGVITKDFPALEDVLWDYFYKGESLFLISGMSAYRYMKEASGLSDADFEKWFYDNIAVTMTPAGHKGGKPGSQANPRLYYTGAKADAAKLPYIQRVIELALDPKLQMDHTVKSGKLPVTKSAQEDPRFKSYKYLSDVAYMLDYTTVRPPAPAYQDYRSLFIKAIENIVIKGNVPEKSYNFLVDNLKQSVGEDKVTYQ